MNRVAKWLNQLNASVANLSIRGAPRLLLLIFSAIFIMVGLLYVAGLLIELYWTGRVNYKSINDFISAYFGVSSVAAFGIIGRALIDSNNDGNPDVWESAEKDEDKEEK